MDVRIATFNIYWFPSSSFIGNRRSQIDQGIIREVIRRLDADIIIFIFQEILDLTALEELLSAFAPARSYRLRDETGRWIASGAEKKNDMKVPRPCRAPTLAPAPRLCSLIQPRCACRSSMPSP